MVNIANPAWKDCCLMCVTTTKLLPSYCTLKRSKRCIVYGYCHRYRHCCVVQQGVQGVQVPSCTVYNRWGPLTLYFMGVILAPQAGITPTCRIRQANSTTLRKDSLYPLPPVCQNGVQAGCCTSCT